MSIIFSKSFLLISAAGGAGRTAIQQAINQYHQDTCLYFRPYQHGDPNYIIFQNGIG